MVLHVRHVPKRNEGNPGRTLFEGRIVACVLRVSQCPTLVRNGKTYEYIISMDNIQLV